MAFPLKLESNDLPKVNDDEFDKEEESFSYAMQMVMSSVMSMGLQTTFELGVFDIIARAGGEGAKLSANDIALQLGMKNPEAPKMLDRLLGMLAAHSLMNCSEEVGPTGPHRIYSLSPASKFFAHDADNMSLGPLLTLVHHKVFMKTWRVKP